MKRTLSREQALFLSSLGLSYRSDMSEAEIEDMREELTVILAKSGFNEDYSVNPDGEKIERIIDLLGP